jgi:hypothetical protein
LNKINKARNATYVTEWAFHIDSTNATIMSKLAVETFMNVTTEFEKDLCLNLTRETATSIYEGCYHSISDSILTELMKKFEGISIVLGEINYFSNINTKSNKFVSISLSPLYILIFQQI